MRIPSPHTCRFCHKTLWNREQYVKYGTRHYAHFQCYLDGGKSLAELRDWQILQFPYFLLKDRGLLDLAYAAAKREGVSQ